MPGSLKIQASPTNVRSRKTRAVPGAAVLASFATLRELFVSRQGAKPAKQQWQLLGICLRLYRARLIADFMLLINLSEKQGFTDLYYEGSLP